MLMIFGLLSRMRAGTDEPGMNLARSKVVESQWTARDRGLQRFVTEQPPYSILVRGVEADVLPTCARHDMAVMSYSPLADDVLDRIDAIVPPGTTINPADSSFNNPALEPAARRR